VNKKYLLIDLDGTLTDTATDATDIALKMMKEGQIDTDLSQIRVFEGAKSFLVDAQSLGFECLIISDSHPNYVNPIVKNFFQGLRALPLADKPNTLKTLKFLQKLNINHLDSICYVLGDSWLDIELGRGLRVPTILTRFYQVETQEIRDGIGDYVKNVKSGPTYYAEKYSNILEILRDPLKKLLCLEAGFKGVASNMARRPCFDVHEDGQSTFHRILARQAQGECDNNHITDKYFEFNRADISKELLDVIRDSFMIYVDRILRNQDYSWDIFTYVPDKGTTEPPNKMGELFSLIVDKVRQGESRLDCSKIFEWSDDVSSSTRKQTTAIDRRKFVGENLSLRAEVDIQGKNIIILDDQYTTGATANTLTEKLQTRGAQNVLFIALFHLISSVNSNKLCPKCLDKNLTKQLQVKINRQTGNKFYSCVLPKYGGNGCCYTENIR
jgi:phosphoglycolate phosphatase-like HAD superfamily hydrolase